MTKCTTFAGSTLPRRNDRSTVAPGLCALPGVYLSGNALDERDARGLPIVDDDFLILLNAHSRAACVHAAAQSAAAFWTLAHRYASHYRKPMLGKTLAPGAILTLEGRSMVVFESSPCASGCRVLK